MRIHGGYAALALVVVGLASGCASSSGQVESGLPTEELSTEARSPHPEASAGLGDSATSRAIDSLAQLPVKGRAPKTDYSREQFGQAWADVDRNGCDTRTDILADALGSISRSGPCVITRGVLQDPFTAKAVSYIRGGVSEVDIDHLVSLSNSWQTGAFSFPFAKRVAFANDPLNLLAVDSAANRQKGDGDAATWLPSNKSFRCTYVARQIAVKKKYKLWVTAPEAAAMRGILEACPGQQLPGPGAQPTLASNTGGQPPPSQGVGGAPDSPLFFRSCADARAAGAAPMRRGTAAYDANTHLDGDSDGIACE